VINVRAHLLRRPRAAAIVAAAVLAVPAAACGGAASSSSTGSGGSAVGYSACIRSHGVPSYPDPDSSGNLAKGDAQQFGVSPDRFRAARHACQSLLPRGGSRQQQDHQCMQNSDCPQSLIQQMLTADRLLAQCMRSHGVPNFPDPITDSHGPIFDISSAGISDAASHAPRFEARLTECGRLAGGNAPESFE
jgi:hypothetical protein